MNKFKFKVMKYYFLTNKVMKRQMILYIKANLIKYLHEHVYQVFRESTCFCHYMQMHRCCVYGQIHRCCMTLELNCSSHQAFIICIHISIFRFTLREFTLISGLNSVSHEKDFNFDTQEPNKLKSQYFSGC
ncbi:hypothetical protein H5410_056965 [Solanum commersonii]|uniref:Uncharacterized protein n=1 Tax=Solanum commersonii TaxID=4109 RepID=A0A9J5WNS1_SOLCO|nr:hypothetical protein H5410_056965 [Solanum commersonii]